MFRPLPLRRAEQAWGGPIPGNVRFIAQVQETAVFITEGWEAGIRGRRFVDCTGAMCAIMDGLGQEFQVPIGIELVEPTDSFGNPLYRQLDRKQVMQRTLSIALWVLTLVAGGLLGALIQRVLRGGL